MKKINIDEWNRKEHFDFFSKMNSPFLGITTDIKFTRAYEKAKTDNISFLHTIYISL